jgi:Spy/CpxP family protein refolding chaperone
MTTLPRLRLATLLLLLLALPLAASAGGKGQKGGKRHHDPEQRLAHMTETLGLSTTQQEQLEPILEQQAESFRALREQKRSGANREELRESFRAQRESNAAQVEAVLDEQQVATFREMRAEREQRMREHRGSRHQRGDGDDPPADDAI